MAWIWWAPLAATVLHIFEEFVWPGGFGAWDRAYRPAFRKSITGRLHVWINAALVALGLTAGLPGLAGGRMGGIHIRSAFGPALEVPLWLALAALLFSNALFHIAGTVRLRQYSPGVGTSLALYIPLALFGYSYFLVSGKVSAGAALAAAAIGGSYHLWASLVHRWRSK